MINYFYLILAIIAEVIATSALKPAQGFSKLLPSLTVLIGYSLSFYLLSIILQTFPLGITYAIWSGMGIVLVTLAAVFLYRQTPDLAAMIGMSLIVLGVIIIQLFSKTSGH